MLFLMAQHRDLPRHESITFVNLSAGRDRYRSFLLQTIFESKLI